MRLHLGAAVPRDAVITLTVEQAPGDIKRKLVIEVVRVVGVQKELDGLILEHRMLIMGIACWGYLIHLRLIASYAQIEVRIIP